MPVRLTVPALLLLERELCPEEWLEEVEDARRWRCMRVGSTSGMFASRANCESTDQRKLWG